MLNRVNSKRIRQMYYGIRYNYIQSLICIEKQQEEWYESKSFFHILNMVIFT